MHLVGTSETEPRTLYYWSKDHDATAKAAILDNLCIVRASKPLRIVAQEDGRTEYWASNLSKLNSYLAGRENTSGGGFRFRLSVDYVPSSSASVTVNQERVKELVEEMSSVESTLQNLKQKRLNTKNQIQNGLDEFVELNQKRLGSIEGQITQAQNRLETLEEELKNKRTKQNAWSNNGVIQTYIIEVSTEAELVPTTASKRAVENHLEEIESTVENSVRRALESSNFRLITEEIESPRVLLDLEHLGLADPENLKQLIEQAPEQYKEELRNLQSDVARQYFASALSDIEINTGETVARKKSTPAWSVQGILKELEKQEILTESSVEVPQTGPSIGTTPAADKTVGFDPAEHGPHYYIAGSSGTGKTHLKRVFMENVASLGYNLINIDPSSYQGIGLSLPNTELEAADPTGIQATHYSPSNKLKEVPSDFNEIFNGISTLSFKDEPASETAAVTASILDQISSHDFADNPLFVFIEEADNFTDTVAIDPLRTLVQEGRKFGVHVVLVSQRPKAFDYTEKDIRQETSYILMNRRYSQNGLGRLFDIDPTNLERGQAVFVDFVDIPEIVVDTRDTLTRLWSGTPTEKEIQQVQETRGDRSTDSRFPDIEDRSTQETGGDRSPGGTTRTGPELTEKEAEVIEAIQSYTDREGQKPSQTKVIKEINNFGAETTRDTLDSLIDKGVVKTSTEMRYGNEATVHEIA